MGNHFHCIITITQTVIELSFVLSFLILHAHHLTHPTHRSKFAASAEHPYQRANTSFGGMLKLILFTLCCTAAYAAVPDTVGPKSVELSPSIQLVGKYDWEILTTETGEKWSRCLDMVW